MQNINERILKNPFTLDGYTTIITGAGGAIGGATAEVFAAAGSNVVVSDLNLDAAKKVVDGINKTYPGRALAVKTDVTKDSELKDLLDQTLNKFGSLTTLINNVGWGEYTPLLGISSEYMIKSYVLNTVSTYQLSSLCAPHLEKSQNASILFSGSRVGDTASPEFLSYSNAKAALFNMVRSMSVAMGPKIRVNMVMIGSVDNGTATLDAGYTQEMLDNLNKAMVMKRRGYPQDIAYAFLYLASPAARWITGLHLYADGGGTYKSKMPTNN